MNEHDEKPPALDRLWDAKLETLGEFLDQLEDGGAMNLEELDGFLAALHCCPVLVPIGEYLPEIFGDDFESEEIFSNIEVLELVFGLVAHHWNVVGEAFQTDDFFVPLLLEYDDGKSYGNDWAVGFLRGVEVRKEHWQEILDDESKMGWFVPIFALTCEHHPDPAMRPYEQPMADEQRETLLAGISIFVTEMYKYFEPRRRTEAAALNHDQGTSYRPSRRKIGRNDPCYCGSGKKYKKCCGAEAVH